jgi:hypothetical protein
VSGTGPSPFLSFRKLQATPGTGTRRPPYPPTDQLLSNLRGALRHNLRDIPAHNADPGRRRRNYGPIRQPGRDPVAAALARWRSEAERQGLQVRRRDAVVAIEAVFSVPLGHAIDLRHFFAECIAWLDRRLGCPVLSAEVHLDEAHPHMHAILLPSRGGRLAGSDVLGGPTQVREHQEDFRRAVALPFGLTAGRTTARQRRSQAAAVIAALRRAASPVTRDPWWGHIRAMIDRDPGPLHAAMGLEPTTAAPMLDGVQQPYTVPGPNGSHSGAERPRHRALASTPKPPPTPHEPYPVYGLQGQGATDGATAVPHPRHPPAAAGAEGRSVRDLRLAA